VNKFRVLIQCGPDEEIVTDDVEVRAQFINITPDGSLMFYSMNDQKQQTGLVIFAPGRWIEVNQDDE
jgi:hypothetical protein